MCDLYSWRRLDALVVERVLLLLQGGVALDGRCGRRRGGADHSAAALGDLLVLRRGETIPGVAQY